MNSTALRPKKKVWVLAKMLITTQKILQQNNSVIKPLGCSELALAKGFTLTFVSQELVSTFIKNQQECESKLVPDGGSTLSWISLPEYFSAHYDYTLALEPYDGGFLYEDD